jgi:chemotaxis protein methyltransferase CheR
VQSGTRGYLLNVMLAAAEQHGPAHAPLLTGAEFELFQKYVYREAGIHLPRSKQALLVARLSKRLRAHGLSRFRDYYDVVQASEAEKRQMFDCITTNETHFFREKQHYQFLEQELLPAWLSQEDISKRSRHVRVWSAACSTGEEPYSIAMTLAKYLPPEDGWDFEIVATDISTRVLERASSGVWPLEKAKEICPADRRLFMLKGTGSNAAYMKASDAIRKHITFVRANLHAEVLPLQGPFDLIFCCNVLIYFDQQSKASTVQRLRDQLAPDGYLFLGRAESLNGISDSLASVAPTVYTHRDRVPARRDRTAKIHPES